MECLEDGKEPAHPVIKKFAEGFLLLYFVQVAHVGYELCPQYLRPHYLRGPAAEIILVESINERTRIGFMFLQISNF